MSIARAQPTYRSIFTRSTSRERQENFEAYWLFSRAHSGELFEGDKDLSKKREQLRYFREHPVRSRQPLLEPAAFYRNFVDLTDEPGRLDRKTLLLCIYKFARNECVGISSAWDAARRMAQATTVTHKISRYHLAEEFCLPDLPSRQGRVGAARSGAAAGISDLSASPGNHH